MEDLRLTNDKWSTSNSFTASAGMVLWLSVYLGFLFDEPPHFQGEERGLLERLWTSPSNVQRNSWKPQVWRGSLNVCLKLHFLMGLGKETDFIVNLRELSRSTTIVAMTLLCLAQWKRRTMLSMNQSLLPLCLRDLTQRLAKTSVSTPPPQQQSPQQQQPPVSLAIVYPTSGLNLLFRATQQPNLVDMEHPLHKVCFPLLNGTF